MFITKHESNQYATQMYSEEYVISNTSFLNNYVVEYCGRCTFQIICGIYPKTVVSQDYDSDADKEYVIAGNSAIVKCDIPSFIADFVTVTGWLEESQDIEYFPSNNFGTTID